MAKVTINHKKVQELVVKKLTEVGLSDVHAKKVAEILVYADLRNVHSHGVLRTEHYVNRIKAGGINTHADITFHKTGIVTGIVDGDDGIGHVVADVAMKHAINIAKEYGVGMVTARNSSHCGALSYFVEQATKHNLIGIAMSHTDKIVVPFGGKKPFLGTNPVAYGIPAKKNAPLILDMATSTVALGKILEYKEEGKSIPLGWGVNSEGEYVTDPKEVVYLTPFGGAKGYGLSIIVDVFSGLLSGSAFGPHITKMYDDLDKKRKLGHYFCVIDPAMFTNVEQFLENMDKMIDELHEVPPAPGVSQVLVPGELEQRHYDYNLKNGISIVSTVYEYLTGK